MVCGEASTGGRGSLDSGVLVNCGQDAASEVGMSRGAARRGGEVIVGRVQEERGGREGALDGTTYPFGWRGGLAPMQSHGERCVKEKNAESIKTGGRM